MSVRLDSRCPLHIELDATLESDVVESSPHLSGDSGKATDCPVVDGHEPIILRRIRVPHLLVSLFFMTARLIFINSSLYGRSLQKRSAYIDITICIARPDIERPKHIKIIRDATNTGCLT